MSSSIFNFKNNTSDIRNAITLFRIGFVCFVLIYIVLLYSLVTGRIFAEFFTLALLLVFFVWLKKYRKVFLILFFSGFIFFIIGEIYFRLSYFGIRGITKFDQYLPANNGDPISALKYDSRSYTGFKPMSHGMLKGGTIYINNLSFRDIDRGFEKKPHIKRILVLGTSISMGVGVNQGENYPAILEKMLNQKNPSTKYEVVSLAMAAWGIDDILDVWKDIGLKLVPDIILIEDGYWGKTGIHHPMRVEYSNLFMGLVKRPVRALFFINAVEHEFIPYFFSIITPWRKAEDPVVKEAAASEEKMRFYFDKIKLLARGKKIYIVALRHMSYLNKKSVLNPELIKFCKQYGFGLINTYDEDYGENAKDMVVYVGDRHPNAKTHRIYAERVQKELKFV